MHGSDYTDLYNFETPYIADIKRQIKEAEEKMADEKDKQKWDTKNGFYFMSDVPLNSEWNGSIDMHVPDKILVAGHNQHVGTSGPPREILFDQSILKTDPYPGDVRVATPPRTITLDKYPFSEVQDHIQEEKEIFNGKKKINYPEDTEYLMNNRLHTPPIGASFSGGGDVLSSSDEVLHLRKQMARLNRRIAALEMENINRLQKEKFALGFGVAYFLLKFVIWMSKD